MVNREFKNGDKILVDNEEKKISCDPIFGRHYYRNDEENCGQTIIPLFVADRLVPL